jgi:5-methylcytosine-specific restriction endonuclease McrA
MKVCSKCKEEKDISEFCKDSSKPDGLYSSCKSCQKSYRKSNKKKIAETNKVWRDKNRDKQINYLREWREENPEYGSEYYQKNKEQKKKYTRQWRIENPDKVFAHNMKRRTNGESEELGKDTWIQVMSSTDWKCFYCDVELDKKNRTIDHVIPIDKGGKNIEENCVPSCLSCNCSKKHTLVTSWYGFRNLSEEKKTHLINLLTKLGVKK